jgi:hypothetical protein
VTWNSPFDHPSYGRKKTKKVRKKAAKKKVTKKRSPHRSNPSRPKKHLYLPKIDGTACGAPISDVWVNAYHSIMDVNCKRCLAKWDKKLRARLEYHR